MSLNFNKEVCYYIIVYISRKRVKGYENDKQIFCKHSELVFVSFYFNVGPKVDQFDGRIMLTLANFY